MGYTRLLRLVYRLCKAIKGYIRLLQRLLYGLYKRYKPYKAAVQGIRPCTPTGARQERALSGCSRPHETIRKHAKTAENMEFKVKKG